MFQTGCIFGKLVYTLIMLLSCVVSVSYASGTVDSNSNPSADQDQSFSFLVWGHPRNNANGKPQLHLDEVLGLVRELHADLLIITGDVILGMWGHPTDPNFIREEWDRFDTAMASLGIPVYIVPGNHDVSNPVTRDIFLERYGERPFAFTFKGSRFVLLDTVGINSQSSSNTLYQPGIEGTWFAGPVPFDTDQLNFIRKEVEQQGQYSHMFLFMHHTRIWANPSEPWWDTIHPLLVGGKTRAIFSANPWPDVKYGYENRDYIHYILSTTFPDESIRYFSNGPGINGGSFYKHLDNLQHVQVNGENYTIRTIALGAQNSENLSWSFWDAVNKKIPWTWKLANQFHAEFDSLRKLMALAAAGALLCLALGAVIGMFWERKRRA